MPVSSWIHLLAFACGTLLLVVDSRQLYVFDRPICTGLGDRMGTMLSLAALARIENASVAFLWCTDPKLVMSRLRQHIPGWSGYNYSLTELRRRIRLPKELVLVDSLSLPKLKGLPRVQWGPDVMPVPAELGMDSIPNIASLTMRLNRSADIDVFQETYRVIAAEMMAGIERSSPYVVLHLRGPDDNTYLNPQDLVKHYCTGKVVKRVQKHLGHGTPVDAISNNVQWADFILDGRIRVLNGRESEFDHFLLLLGAAGIVQHAYGGWSSFSSVAALISGAPMISTYHPWLFDHRFLQFRRVAGLPVNYYDCDQTLQFISAVDARLTQYEPSPTQLCQDAIDV